MTRFADPAPYDKHLFFINRFLDVKAAHYFLTIITLAALHSFSWLGWHLWQCCSRISHCSVSISQYRLR